MSLLIAGLILFFGIHIVASTSLKTTLVSQITANRYKGLFTLVSLVGLIMIIAGKAQAPFQFVWNGLPELRVLALPFMWVSFVLLPAAHMKGNVKRITRHPMLWGIVCWSGIHLILNGDLASLLLFGSFLVYALYAMVSQNQRGARKQQVKMPFKYDLIVCAAGTTVFIIVLLLHGVLFGVPLV